MNQVPQLNLKRLRRNCGDCAIRHNRSARPLERSATLPLAPTCWHSTHPSSPFARVSTDVDLRLLPTRFASSPNRHPTRRERSPAWSIRCSWSRRSRSAEIVRQREQVESEVGRAVAAEADARADLRGIRSSCDAHPTDCRSLDSGSFSWHRTSCLRSSKSPKSLRPIEAARKAFAGR